MKRIYYDLHLHSCLSPCGDDAATPTAIAGFLALSGYALAALTDHNTVDNCPAFFEACEAYGVIPIAGMELTTSEDIHVVCLFEHLSDALAFGKEIEGRRCKIPNRPDIFGHQEVMNADEEVLGEECDYLLGATDLSLEDLPDTVGRYGGVCYPAHIDRDANGVIAVLGTFPETPSFSVVEIHDGEREDEYRERFSLTHRFVCSSDAHRLEDLREAKCYFEIPDGATTPDEVRREVFRLLGKEDTQLFRGEL